MGLESQHTAQLAFIVSDGVGAIPPLLSPHPPRIAFRERHSLSAFDSDSENQSPMLPACSACEEKTGLADAHADSRCPGLLCVASCLGLARFHRIHSLFFLQTIFFVFLGGTADSLPLSSVS